MSALLLPGRRQSVSPSVIAEQQRRCRSKANENRRQLTVRIGLAEPARPRPRPCRSPAGLSHRHSRALIGAHCEWLSSGWVGEAAQRACSRRTRGHSQCRQTGRPERRRVRTANGCGHSLGLGSAALAVALQSRSRRAPCAASRRSSTRPSSRSPHPKRQPACLPLVRSAPQNKRCATVSVASPTAA